MRKIKQFNFTISNGVVVMIRETSLESASERFKVIFGEFLFRNVKYVEIC